MADTTLLPKAAPAPRPAGSRVLQRKCACGTHAPGGGDCEACRREALQRKGRGGAAPHFAPPLVHQVLGQPGRSLEPGARSYLEPRFGRDFSGVRVHADSEAARSARAVQAHAYTVGNHVVFGEGQYRPHHPEGLRLLAHELSHVVQQSGRGAAMQAKLEVAPEDSASEREADAMADAALAGQRLGAVPALPASGLQRKVADQFPKIKDDLTYGLFDWAITDSEAREVLGILKGLSEPDLADTVAAMQQEGLVGRFFDNLPEKETKDNQAFLRQVSRLQSWKEKGDDGKETTRKGSCTPDQMKTVKTVKAKGQGWLDEALTKLDGLRSAPNDAKQKGVSDIFKARFGSLDPKVTDYVRGILAGVRNDFQNWDLLRLDCPGEWDKECHEAGAYAQGGPPPSVTFCPSFFDSDEEDNARRIIHEISHIQPGVAHITDRAYRSDRLIRDLKPEEALTNADSYALFVKYLVTGKSGVYAPEDEHPDCPKEWTEDIDAAAARAERSNRNAQVSFNSLRPSNLGTKLTAQEQTWLGGKDDKAIERAQGVFDAAKTRFEDSITFECEPDGGGRCPTSEAYWYAIGRLHMCPSWKKLGPEAQEISLLASVYGYIGEGKDAGERRRFAQLAHSISGRGWAAPKLGDVLSGDPTWTADALEVRVEPVHPKVPGRSYYPENGHLHKRMSEEMATYQGPECGMKPIPFEQSLSFLVDDNSQARPQPFLPPVLRAEYVYTAGDASFTKRFEDRRPIYQGAGQPLQNQIPDPIELSLAKDGTLHSKVEMADGTSGVTRTYEDDLKVKVQDPCPKAAQPDPAKVNVRPADKADVAQIRTFVASTRASIAKFLSGPAPKDDPWATSSNPNVKAVTDLLADLEGDLTKEAIALRFDQPVGQKEAAHYDFLANEMHLQPPAGADMAKEVVDLVHEYTHLKQDKAEEGRLVSKKAPTVFNPDVDLQQEIDARREETYFTRLMQLAGGKFGPNADSFGIELTARTFVREFEEERKGKPSEKKAATKAIRKEIGDAYAQQFKDNGSFGDYPIEITEGNHALLHGSWKAGTPPVDLGELPADVTDSASLQGHLYRTLKALPGLPDLFKGPKKQAYDRVLFTVFFRARTLLQFGFMRV